MGASLVGRSHCETPVLIWTSGAVVSLRVMSRYCLHQDDVGATHSSISVICLLSAVSRGIQCDGGAVQVTRAPASNATYELSHCAIHPAGIFGSVESVGPESGDTGG
jgi:hypothetical protein